MSDYSTECGWREIDGELVAYVPNCHIATTQHNNRRTMDAEMEKIRTQMEKNETSSKNYQSR
jgi:hypothetical protein